MLKPEQKIVVIGGGTGTPVVNEALILAGAKNITDIVSVADDGGITGRMRIDYEGRIAVSDGFRSIRSLVNPLALENPQVQAAFEPLNIRTPGRHLGYEMLWLMSHNIPENGFAEIQDWLTRVSGMPLMGHVFPVTTVSTNIIAQTESGRTLVGEHRLDEERMSKDRIVKLSLEPEADAFPPALEAMTDANWIISAIGSLGGSVFANYLVKGVPEAYREAKATRIHITNLTSTRNETHNFTPEKIVKAFKKYTGMKHPLDVLVVPQLSRREFNMLHPLVAKRYGLDHSNFLGWTEEQLEKSRKELGITILTHDATIITKTTDGDFLVRHNPQKLAEALKKIE